MIHALALQPKEVDRPQIGYFVEISLVRHWVLAALVPLVVACGSPREEDAEPLNYDRLSTLQILAFETDTTLLVRRLDRLGGGDVWLQSCDSTGILRVTFSGAEEWIYHDNPQLCDIISRAPDLSLRRDHKSLLFSDQFDYGRIKEYSLADGAIHTVYSGCLPVIGWPVWSSTGDRIAFQAAKCGGSDTSALAILSWNSDAALEPMLFPFVDGEDKRHFSWAPSDSALAVQHGTVAGTSGIFIAHPATRQVRRIADGRYPSWSPSGEAIALFTDRGTYGSDWEVSLYDLSGKLQLQLVQSKSVVDDTLYYGVPRLMPPILWSPTAERIAFVVGNALWTVKRDGTGLHRIR